MLQIFLSASCFPVPILLTGLVASPDANLSLWLKVLPILMSLPVYDLR